MVIKMASVMVVEDNENLVEALKNIMETQGHITNVAYNGEEFLSKVENINPDLVLLDIMMPGLTTKEILDGLKEKGFERLKIILVTAILFSEDEIGELTKNYNIVDYIMKPFKVSDLVNRVNKALNNSR